MSSPLSDVWGDRAEPRCKTPALVDTLSENDLLGAGVGDLDDLDDDELELELTERDADRVRLVKFLASHPSGVALKTLVSLVLKGQQPGRCQRIDGSDSDYQFARRFTDDLAAKTPEMVEKRKTKGSWHVSPTYRLLDLISEGITQTNHANESNLYDREFCRELLKRSDSLDERGKELLEDALHSYIGRIDEYRLLFDVHFAGRTGGRTTKQMTKNYKTRFNDRGRIAKTFARFNDGLEHQFERADNAVLATLTTDPGTYADPTRPDPRPLLDQISSINKNFNRLLSYFDSDPSTKSDTRHEGVCSWSPELDQYTTGRPRARPSYIKALEFTEKGYPHLHVLFFDVPERQSDGMPWLCDKAEISKKWKDYGQGQIVDTYPLTYRDDLDELGNFGEDTTEGFVDWYRYGDHDHSDEWVEQAARAHEQIDFYNLSGQEVESGVRYATAETIDHVTPENADPNAIDVLPDVVMQKTAGAYLGKYLSATFGGLLDASDESLDADDDRFEDKAASWKLALYWASNRRFWSISRDIERGIEIPEHIRDPHVRRTVRWATVDTLERCSRGPVTDHLARRQWDDLDDLADAAEWLTTQVVQPGIQAELPESADFTVAVDYIGAFRYWDLPAHSATAPDLEHVETHVPDGPDGVSVDQIPDRPPPAVDVWNSAA